MSKERTNLLETKQMYIILSYELPLLSLRYRAFAFKLSCALTNLYLLLH